MSDIVQQNLVRLLESGVNIEVGKGGKRLEVSRLPLTTAVALGHTMTVLLDAMNGGHMYATADNRLGDKLFEANHRLELSETTLFGETRPAGRNLAVRVDLDPASSVAEDRRFTLLADVRNEYEDNPELSGGRRLQLGFIAAIGALDPQYLPSS